MGFKYRKILIAIDDVLRRRRTSQSKHGIVLEGMGVDEEELDILAAAVGNCKLAVEIRLSGDEAENNLDKLDGNIV